jgi:hypothetical protein
MRVVSYVAAIALLSWLTALSAAQEKKGQGKKGDAKKESAKTEPEKKTGDKKAEEKKNGEKKDAQKDKRPRLQVELIELYNPCGVAVQPGTGDVFIADSGHLRILRYKPQPEPTISEEIVEFPRDIFGKGPRFTIGPLGLAFLNRNTLVVADGGKIDGEELLRFYDVSTGTTKKADDMKTKLGPIKPAPGKTEKGEGNFYAIAYVKPTALYITTNGDDTKGWVAKATIKDNEPQDLTLSIATKLDTGDVDAPVGITISPDNKLVIGQMGENNKPKDSLLLIYDVTGDKPKLALKAETGLYDIVALAYHPKSKNLYALDYAWMEEKSGGLFRLTVSGEGAKATVQAQKIDLITTDKGEPAALAFPTAMAFDDQGVLYVTEIVTPIDPDKEDDQRNKPGRLVRIHGLE